VLVVTHDHRTLDVFDELHEMEDGRLRPAPSSSSSREGPSSAQPV
jgi:ABC-type lipoprotein export system ATPase subunit